MMLRYNLQELSDLIAAIYDCALEPERWREALPRLLALTQSPCGALAIHDYDKGRTGRLFDHGYDESYLKLYFEKYQDMNPLPVAMQTLDVGVVATQAMLIDDDEFVSSRFYTELLKPHGLRDAITTIVLRSQHRIAILLANRLEKQPRYGDSDVQLWRLLGPHVCRALAISDAIELRTLNSDALEAALDALTVGVFLTDRAGRIVHANKAGEHQLKTGNALRIANHSLAAGDGPAHRELLKAIAAAATIKPDEISATKPIALPAMDGRSYIANVLPLDAGERRKLLAPFAATIAVFVQDPTVAPPLPGEAFAKIHGLTGAELRVLVALAPGLAVKEAAEMLGISEATAKTHLHHIFAKTGTTRQTELLRRLLATAPPIRMT